MDFGFIICDTGLTLPEVKEPGLPVLPISDMITEHDPSVPQYTSAIRHNGRVSYSINDGAFTAAPMNGNLIIPTGTHTLRFTFQDATKVTINSLKVTKIVDWGYHLNTTGIALPGMVIVTEVPNQLARWMENIDNLFDGAVLLNQDASGWDTTHVTSYINYDRATTAWVLPKPVFL